MSWWKPWTWGSSGDSKPAPQQRPLQWNPPTQVINQDSLVNIDGNWYPKTNIINRDDIINPNNIKSNLNIMRMITGVGVGVGLAVGAYTTPLTIPAGQSPPIPAPVVMNVPSPTFTPYPTLTPYPTKAPPQKPAAPVVDRCSLFNDIQMSYVFLDLEGCNSTMTLYVKMPNGVPGLEKEVPGDNGDWKYTVQIGDYDSTNCETDPSYKGRLYCQYNIPSEYFDATQPLSVHVNGCDRAIYNDQNAFMPSSACVSKPKPKPKPNPPVQQPPSQYSCAGEASCPAGYWCDTSSEICLPKP